MKTILTTPEEKKVQKHLQNLYDHAEALENNYVLGQVLQITETLDIEILM